MKPRSPVLGYNHNVRYAGRLWHVQTEDSGVNNPHIFTHLFHNGTILATSRSDYDPGCDVTAVQKVMQVQHKAMLRDLKAGAFDEKITRFFGEPIVKEREDQTDPGQSISGEFDSAPKTDPTMQAPPPPSSSASVTAQRPAQPRVVPPVERPPPARTAASSTVGQPRTPATSRPNLTPSRPAIPVAASRSSTPAAQPHSPRAPVTGIGGRRAQGSGVAHPYGGGKPTAEGVVVARPSVIVGGDPQGTSPRATVGTRQRSFTPPPPSSHQPAAPAPSKTPTSDNIFGGDLISEKSLDEVILAYLSEDLNDK
ncbi:MAG: hypothetical protein ACXVCV_06845 [Polyangia bacterium]